MSETAKITFYSIDACGYFKRGVATPEFGTLRDLLTDLKAWAAGKQLGHTKCFEPGGDEDLHSVYIADLVQVGDDWLLVTWNETPSSDNHVASIRTDSKVGASEVVMNEIEENSIPGFATYFWFVPEKEVFATVRFSHQVNGQRGMQAYMSRFLANFGRYTRYGEVKDGVIPVVGYALSNTAAPQKLSPRFWTSLYRKSVNEAAIKARRTDIRKVIQRAELQYSTPRDLAFWQKTLQWMHLSQTPAVHTTKARVKSEIEHSPTEEELDSIFNSWKQNEEPGVWDNVGFCFSGESQPVWLDSCLAKDDIEIEVTRTNSEWVGPGSLLSALTSQRANLLGLLD